MFDTISFTYVWARARVARVVRDERGEGVISAALVVLIMAILAALMWVAFESIWDTARTKTSSQVSDIGK
jgi:hypothetical protein